MHNHIRYHAIVPCVLGIGIEETKPQTRIDVFPNPVRSEIRIHFNNSIDGPVNCTLTDLFGREVKTRSFNATYDSKTDFMIPVDILVDGVYILKVSTEAYSYSEKIIIHH
jgi:hypothetical protein